jgi:hypothetical protein
MSKHPLAEDYLRWLASQTRDEQDGRGKEYWDLLSIMFEKEFVEDRLVPNDDNRLADGLELRKEFCYAQHIRVDGLRRLGPCSFLEVLVGLSRRLAFAASGTAPGWAWQLMCNLELDKMSDPLTRRKVQRVDEILDRVIWRTYAPDGSGGFFPLAWPDEDQTQKELWYQMAAYIDELHPEH